jgi:hypothetical protein
LSEIVHAGVWSRNRTFEFPFFRWPHQLGAFQADLTFLFGTDLADPDDSAARGIKQVFIWNEFDNLTPLKSTDSEYPKTFQRRIKEKTGNPFWVALQLDDQTGAALTNDPLRPSYLHLSAF